MLVAGTVAVPEFAVSVIIAGAFEDPDVYQVLPGANWLTRSQVIGKTPTQFQVLFTIPVPAGGGLLDYVVVLQ
jgi:hypothetical protein